MFKSLASFVCIISTSLPTSAWAVDFTQADQLFAARPGGSAVIAQARDAYGALLPTATADEKIYAVEMMGRLDYYEGLIVSDNAVQERIFEACLSRVEDNLPKSGVEYHYWKATCLASWAKARGVLQSLARSAELVELCNDGNAIDSSYEGGGFNRILAAAYARLPPINPVGPSRDYSKSLDFANRAIASPAYAGEADPSTATGDYFFNAYEFQAEALVGLGRRAEAIAGLEGALQRIDAGEIPVGREPETARYREALAAALARLR